jgi:hypothetical protein
LRFRGTMRGSLSGTLATMGPGVPYGIGAKFGNPERPVIVFAGDGAMQMNGLAELITIKHYWQQWTDPRLVIAILHNNDLNQVTWEMRAMEGAPSFTASQTLPDVDYAAFTRSLDLGGITVDKPDQIATAWERALSADRPTILDVHTDPDVPPIPPHSTFEQMKDTAKALLSGDSSRLGIIKEGAKPRCRSSCRTVMTASDVRRTHRRPHGVGLPDTDRRTRRRRDSDLGCDYHDPGRGERRWQARHRLDIRVAGGRDRHPRDAGRCRDRPRRA